jgi:hypothetical protein
MTSGDMWSARSGSGFGDAKLDVVGYGVEAIDGSIGKIDEATYDTGSSYVVVDTGPWILGKKVLLPAGIVDRVDADDEKVYVSRTKDQIKNAPEYEEGTDSDAEYRDRVGGHYGPGGRGYTA